MLDHAMLLPTSDAARLVFPAGGRVFAPEISPKSPCIPFFAEAVPAGFPSPAQGHEEARLDINSLVIRNPEATFFLQVRGDSMRDANILDGDIVVVDKSINARHGHIVIAEIDGAFTVKTLWRRGGRVRLVPANKEFRPIEIPEGTALTIFGVVSWIIHRAPR